MNHNAALSLSIWTLVILVVAAIIIAILIFLVKAGIISNFNILSSLFNSSQGRGISQLVGVQTTFTPYNCSSKGCVVFNAPNSFWWAYYDGINQSAALNQLSSAITFTTGKGNFQLIAYPINIKNMLYCSADSNKDFSTQSSYNISYSLCGVTFYETGLPNNYYWIVEYNNSNYSSSSQYIPVIAANPGKYIVWNETNSSFDSAISEECTTKYYPSSNSNGYETSPGEFISIPFTSSTTCERIITTFVESGLPENFLKNYVWSVNYNNTWNSSHSNTISFSTMSGSHKVYIPILSNSSNNCVTVYVPSYSSSVTAGTSDVQVKFANYTKCLTTFIEENLPPGYIWYIKYDGMINHTLISSTSSKLTINATVPPPNTNNQLLANASVSGLYCAPSPNGISVNPGESTTFSSWLCNSTFNETGLPSGTQWNITYDNKYNKSNSHLIRFININSSSSKIKFTAYPIPVSSSTITTSTTFSIVGSGSSTGGTSASYTLPVGASLYLCNGGDGNGGLSQVSWTVDASGYDASAGNQLSNVCNDSSGSSDIVVGGIALNTNEPYSLQKDGFSWVSNFSYIYSESQESNVIISISCGWYECDSINVPSGCQQLFYTNGGDNYETTYMAVCYNQGSGNYKVSGDLNGQGGVAIAIYSFPISTTTSTIKNYYDPTPSSGYNYTGLNQTIKFSPSQSPSQTVLPTIFYESGLSGYSGDWTASCESQTGSAALGSSISLPSITQPGSASATLSSYSCSSSIWSVTPQSSNTFSSWSCTTKFDETGVPTGYQWCMTYNGQQECSSSNSNQFSYGPGSYYYSTSPVYVSHSHGSYYYWAEYKCLSSGYVLSGSTVSLSYYLAQSCWGHTYHSGNEICWSSCCSPPYYCFSGCYTYS